MPIISKEQIKTLLALMLFGSFGIFFFQIFSKGGKFSSFPQTFFEGKKAQIRLRGAVSSAGIRLVNSNQTVWQVVIENNSWKFYINWKKINLSQRVYDGMDLFVPFRKLRFGETISLQEIITSKGILFQVIPCKLSNKFKRARNTFEQHTKNIKISKSLLIKIQQQKCFQKFISF